MEKQRSLRQRFESNYTAVTFPAKNRRGVKVKYVYCAPWYVWNLSANEFHSKKLWLILASVISFVIFSFSVSMPCILNNNKIVFGLSSLALCCHIMESAALVQFLFSKKRTTKMTYETVSRGLDFFPAMRAIFMAAAASVCLVVMFLNLFSAVDIGVTFSFMACAVLAWREHLCFKQIPISIEKNDTLKRIEQEAQRKENC